MPFESRAALRIFRVAGCGMELANAETSAPCVRSLSGLNQGGCLPQYVLKLYVTGSNPRAELAVLNLRRICDQELAGKYDLEIIDVLENPQLAEDEKILATPTLIKQLPPPLRRVIGDLSDTEKVLLGLEVRPQPPAQTPSSDS
jgi:circadian clock protein KaiB